LFLTVFSRAKRCFNPVVIRGFHLGSVNRVKEIKETRDGNTITIEAVVSDSDRKHFLAEVHNPNGACPICRLGLDIRYTDVLILDQFITHDGKVLPQRVTGLCNSSHKKIKDLVWQAQRAGLIRAQGEHKPLSERQKWEAHNTYFETEEEIMWKERDVKEKHFYERPPKTKKLELTDIL